MGIQGEFTCDPTAFKVTPEMIQSYNDVGYFLVRGFLSNPELDKLKTAVEHDRFFEKGFGLADGTGKESRLVMWRHPGNDVTGMFARSEKIAGTCEQVLGGEVYHYHTKLMTKAARTGGKHIWHQDYGYWYKNGCLFPDMMISGFIPIDRCYKENGCLEILVGSHKCGRIEHTMKAGQTGADLDRVAEIRKICPHTYVEMDAGDALFFHANLLHTSGDNLSDTKRWVLIPCYNRKDNNPLYEHHHPQYTPLEKVKDSAFLECQNFDDLSGKMFNRPEEDKTVDGNAH
ncbi:L-proline trans-4-hydroxylase [Aplysia californica]|uniref:L-proline trans-4-hydroxylase n=1 Tax=Aplysia californica TaxID=6500 RepID=A0ABM0JD48_APLCA|nr:L-proline trans-4-hydroxylase [Aplysia californica]